MGSNKKLKAVRTPVEQHWVGDGFHVHTLFHPAPDIYPMTDPFILMDYAPKKMFTPNSSAKRGVGEHPHRGFETVTFAYAGEIEHRDSGGGGGTIGEGGVQWMTAGNGVVHEEFHSHKFSQTGGEMEMVQLWVNLPRKDKMTTPRYQGVTSEQFPLVELGKSCRATVVAGKLNGKIGPCKTFSKINVFKLSFGQVEKLSIPTFEASNTLVLIRQGELSVEGKKYSPKSLLAYEQAGDSVEIDAIAGTELLFLSGIPLNEPIAAHGPFVMSTQEEIIQAIRDYQQGKMGHLN